MSRTPIEPRMTNSLPHDRAIPERQGGATIIAFRAPVRVACIDPSTKGLIPLYDSGMACPGCRRRSWLIGRLSAECAGCGTSLELPASSGRR